jgi:hypothetical protein
MLIEGLAERRVDPDVPSPRGSGADRWHWLESSIGLPAPTGRILCDRCAARAYQDTARYRAALTAEAAERLGDLHEVEIERDEPQSNCEACAGPLLPVWRP